MRHLRGTHTNGTAYPLPTHEVLTQVHKHKVAPRAKGLTPRAKALTPHAPSSPKYLAAAVTVHVRRRAVNAL
jgi:hypothetical protein